MTYVDLNPIRAGIASTPECSEFTSIHDRIRYWKQQANQQVNKRPETSSSTEPFQPDTLLPFVGNPREPMPTGIAFSLIDYLELVDWTGRQIRDDKRGSIPDSESPILQRLGISAAHWIYLCTNFESRFKGLVGTIHSLKQHCASFGYKTVRNKSASTLLFS